MAGAEVEDYFEDREGRLARLLDALADNREAVNNSFEIYVSQTTHRTNQVIKVLTMVSTVLFTSSVLIGLFGATVQGLASNAPTGFVLMLVCIVSISAATLWAFRRRGWL